MLKAFATIVIDMLSEEMDNSLLGSLDEVLQNLEINPELKAIIYECLHAQDKISEKEQENYESEINSYILKEKMKKQQMEAFNMKEEEVKDEEFTQLMEFKKTVEKDKEEEDNKTRVRNKLRKGNPKANKKNYDEENKNFGVENEVDLVLQNIAGQKNYNKEDYALADGKFERDLHRFSNEVDYQ